MNLIQQIEAEEIAKAAKDIPEFRPGDTVRITRPGGTASGPTTGDPGRPARPSLPPPTRSSPGRTVTPGRRAPAGGWAPSITRLRWS